MTREELFDGATALAARIQALAPGYRDQLEEGEGDEFAALSLLLIGLDGPAAEDLYDVCDLLMGDGETIADPDAKALSEEERDALVGACVSGALLMLAAVRGVKPSQSVTEGSG
jgi:hypothetical protein